MNLKENNMEKYCSSVELQKIIIMPRMTGVKTCAFTRHIITFNEIFAELSYAKNNVVVVWNESAL